MASSAAPTLKKVQIQRDNLSFDAYVVGEENAPGIVVLQEWWGIDFEVKKHTVTISQFGYKALIPDLYRGKVGLDAEEAKHLVDGLNWQDAIKDIAASVSWLKSNGSDKVGVTGYCLGGALAIASGVLVPGISAVVAFYGVPPAELADASQTKAPVQAHFGELDNIVGISDITAANSLKGKLESSGSNHEVHIYPGNGHAFMNRSEEGMKKRKAMGMDEGDDEAVELAWSRFNSWMTLYLSPSI